jgi:hypothetical protein
MTWGRFDVRLKWGVAPQADILASSSLLPRVCTLSCTCSFRLRTPFSCHPTLTPVSLSAGFALTALALVSTTPRFLSGGYAVAVWGSLLLLLHSRLLTDGETMTIRD